MARINLTPNSDSEPERSPVGDQQVRDANRQYDREQQKKLDQMRLRVVTEAGATGVAYRGKRTSHEEAVERVQQMLRSGRVTLAQAKAEHDADEQLLHGWKAAPPRPGTPAAARREEVLQRYRIRAAALDREVIPGMAAPTREGRFKEANDCHTPAGSSGGGQFCSKSGVGRHPRTPEDLSKNPAPYALAPGERYKPALTPDEGRAMARRLKQEQDAEDAAARRAAQYGGKAKTLPEPDLSWTKAVRDNFAAKRADATWASDQALSTALGGFGRLAELRKTGKTIRAEDVPLLRQAAEDWTSGRASRSRSGKGWRVRTQRSDVPTSRYGGRATVPAWSKVVTRYFGNTNTDAFHRFARSQ